MADNKGIGSLWGYPLIDSKARNAINDTRSNLENDFQKKNDDTLTTTNKTIVGSINEVNTQCKDIVNENFVRATPSTIQELLVNHRKVKLANEEFKLDITLPVGTELIGEGDLSYINGTLSLNSNCKITNLKLGGENKSVVFQNNSNNIIIENCIITKGLTDTASGGGIYVNDINLSNVFIKNCTFKDCNSNGVKLVDKGDGGNIHDIYFEKCKFFNNVNANFEIIGRGSYSDTVKGYYNINLKDCVFEKEDNTKKLNVSYDGAYYTNNTDKVYVNGKSTIENCKMTNGLYPLELAGATEMIVKNNIINGGTIYAISTSKVGNSKNNSLIYNNTINSVKSCVFAGTLNSIRDNNFNGSNVILETTNLSTFNNNSIVLKDESIGKGIQVRTTNKLIIKDNIIDFRNSNIKDVNYISLQYAETKDVTIINNNFFRGNNNSGGVDIEITLNCDGVKNRIGENYYNNNKLSSTPGRFQSYTKIFTTSNKTIATFRQNIKNAGLPNTIIDVEVSYRLNNTVKFSKATIYLASYDTSNAAPIIVQDTTNESCYPLSISIEQNNEGKYDYKLNLDEKYTFNSSLVKITLSQTMPLDMENNNYWIW